MKNAFLTIICGLLCCAWLGGCTRALPLISHAHVGHSLTSWRDTPGQQGLFVVAEKEVDIALDEARLANRTSAGNDRVLTHVANVIHAFDPDQGSGNGSGTGYGAIRALEGATEHMVYAAQTDDASENLIKMTERFSEGAAAVRERMKLATHIAFLIQDSEPADRPGLSARLFDTLDHIRNGKDANADGRIDANAAEVGLVQLREGISEALKAEEPAYHPIGRHYLLGLVRLPSGGWAYRFDQSGDAAQSSYEYGY